MLSAWFAGEVTLLPVPYLRVGVLLAYGVSGVCGLRKRSRLPFVVRHPFPVSVGPSPFLGLGWFGHRFVAPPALLVLDSSDARLHRPDALASGRTLSFCRRGSLPWALFGLGLVGRVRASVPPFFWWCSPSLVLGFRLAPLAVGWSRHLLFLGPYLGFFPLASSVGCWLGVVEVYPWLSSLRSFAAEVVTLVFCRALVELPA